MPLNFMYRNLGNFLSPAGDKARLSILIYHRVLPETDPLMPSEVTVSRFDKQLDLLKKNFNVLPLLDAVQRLQQGSLPSRAACITFDDGYADNYTLASPILQRHGLPATFFIASSYLNGGRMFNDTVIEAIRRTPLSQLDLSELSLGIHNIHDMSAKRELIGLLLPKIKYFEPQQRTRVANRIVELAKATGLPEGLMMTDQQLQKLHAIEGMEIGGHTSNHPILATLDDAAVRDEIISNKQYLESLLDSGVRSFAYPNGKPGVDYLPQQARIVHDLGFEAAVSTQWGAASKGCDVFQLPRFTPWHQSHKRFVPMLLGNLR